MNYNLYQAPENNGKKKPSVLTALKTLIVYMVEEKRTLVIAFASMIISAVLTLAGPIMIGYAIDHYVVTKQYQGVLVFSAVLLFMYIVSLVTGFIQTKLMGTVGQ
ncbi:MAG: Xenobiotic-transporting ATPase, partial [Bacteroidetes bacterium]|nr:Xenobiotic-transporting ATPase [Bacteroidota bacterium]